MPKIIEDLEGKLLAEARRQIEESGYGAMTVRSVAKACGVGVGTVYNYFPSKDALVATYMLADWKTCVAAIEAVSTYSDSHILPCSGTRPPLPGLPVPSAPDTQGFGSSWLPLCGNSATVTLPPNSSRKAC